MIKRFFELEQVHFLGISFSFKHELITTSTTSFPNVFITLREQFYLIKWSLKPL